MLWVSPGKCNWGVRTSSFHVPTVYQKCSTTDTVLAFLFDGTNQFGTLHQSQEQNPQKVAVFRSRVGPNNTSQGRDKCTAYKNSEHLSKLKMGDRATERMAETQTKHNTYRCSVCSPLASTGLGDSQHWAASTTKQRTALQRKITRSWPMYLHKF